MIKYTNYIKRTGLLIVLFILTFGAKAQTTIVNFDFNSGSSYATLTPTLASGITCSATSTETFALGTGITTGTNAFVTNSTAGKALAMANSSGTNTRYFQFQLSGSELSKYSTYKIYCQASRATTGATLITLSYSTDGTSFTNFSTTQTPGLSSFSECIFDLSSITAINSQTSVYFKFSVSGASGTGAFGIDNFQVRGTACTTPTLSISATSSTICAGSTTTLTASGATNYTWSPGGAITATVAISPTVTTTYTLTGANGVCTSSTTAAITVNALPTVAISNPTPSICIGNSTSLTASGASTYTWNPGGSTTTSVTVSPTVTIIYTVTGTSSAGCVKTATSTVTVNSLPTLTITNSPTITCTNTTVVITSTTTTGGLSYTWTPGGANTASASVSSGGTYSLLIKDANGCTLTKTVSISTNTTVPTLTITNSPTITCSSATVVITSTTTTSGATYSWSPVSGSTSSLSVTSSGTYSLKVTDPANGCNNTKTVSIITNTTTPSFTILEVSDITCASPTVVITSTATSSGYNYTWTPGGIRTSSLSVTSGGTYSLLAQDPANSCKNTQTVSITTNTTAPTLTITNSPTITCTSPTVVITSTTSTSGVTYSWSPVSGSSSSVSVSSAGTYSLKISDITNGCSSTKTVSIVAAPTPSIGSLNTQDVNCLAGQNGTATAVMAAGSSPYNYTWNSASTGTQSYITGLAAGSYTLQVKDTYSCTATQTFTIQRCPVWTTTATPVTINNNGDLIKSGGADSWTDALINTNAPFIIKDTVAWVSFDLADTASSFLLGFSSVSGDTIAQPAHYKFYIENASATLIEMDNDGFYNKMEIAKVKPGSHIKIQLVSTGIEYYVSPDANSTWALVYTSKLFGTRPMILEGILNRTGSRVNKVRVSGNGN